MYMGKEALVKFLESFDDAVMDLFCDTIDEVEEPAVDDRLRKIRDDVHNHLLDLLESIEEGDA